MGPPRRSRLLRALPAVGYALLILYASSRTASEIPSVPYVQSAELLHLAEYFVFGVLLVIPALGLSWRWRFLALAVGSAYAAFDELYQTTVPGRHGDPIDFAIDIAGLLLAVAVSFVVVPVERAAKAG